MPKVMIRDTVDMNGSLTTAITHSLADLHLCSEKK